MKPIFQQLMLMLAALAMLSGCAGTTTGPSKSASAGTDRVFVNEPARAANSEDYRIGIDDLVKVSVWKNDDLSVEVPVRPDGKISVPLIGDVVVGGKTPAEVSDEVTRELSTYLRDPKVTVILSDLRSHEFLSRVRVTGAVETPISLPYRQGMTVLDAVLEAGGVTKFASADATKIYRKEQAGVKGGVRSVKLNRILKKGDLSSNYSLMPGDVITVPERFF